MIRKFLRVAIPNLNLIYGDPTTLDRWRWISRRLPKTRDNWSLLDVGCGSGAFTIKAASRGYDSIGISWDEKNNNKAISRAKISNLSTNCKFHVHDVRNLNEFPFSNFDVIINTENIEHIINDIKLIEDIYKKLKPGGFLLMTAPYYFYNAMTPGDNGPFSTIEDGGHVRRGYTKTMIYELFEKTGFKIEELSSCTGYTSQKITFLFRVFTSVFGLKISWLLVLPLRIIPLIFDPIIKQLTNYKDLSICTVAYKPRF